MFTVICPTMWFGEELERNLPLIESSPAVGEIIIIDNNREKTPDWFKTEKWKKVLTITPSKNIFVNPAWNLAVKISKYDQLCLIQDDVVFNPNIFKFMESKITPDCGVVGAKGSELKVPILLSDNEFKNEMSKLVFSDFIQCQMPEIVPGTNDWLSVLMFLHKTNWIPVDERLTIHYGECWVTFAHFAMKKNPLILKQFNTYSNSSHRTTSIVREQINCTLPNLHNGRIAWIKDQVFDIVQNN